MMRTYGEVMDEALKCETPEEAVAWLEKEVALHVRDYDQTPEEAKSIVLSNIGYMAGYYSDETRLKIKRLFNADHPIFGDPTKGLPTPEEAFEAGRKSAEELTDDA